MGDWTDLLPRLGQSSGLAEFAQNLQNSRSANRQNDAQTQVLGAQFQQLQARAAQEQQYQRDTASYLAITDPKKQTQALSDLIAKYPDKANDLKKSWDVKDEAAKRADLGWMGETVSAFDAGKPDLARANLQRRFDADKAAGLDTSEDESWLAAIDSKDPKAIAYVRGAMLAHIAAVDPDRYSQNFDTASKPGSPFTLSPGQERRDPITGEVVAKAPFAPRIIKVVRDGQTYYEEYQPGGGDLGSGAPGSTAPPAYSGGPVTVDTLKPLFSAQESSGSYTARNPETGAMGRWQIMPGTGAKLAKKLGLEWRPDMMLHDRPEDREYQDKIGTAAMAEAVAVANGDPAKAFSYYYSGNPNAYRNAKGNPKTAKYVSDMMTRLAGGDPRASGASGVPQTGSGLRVVATGDAPAGNMPNGGASDDAISNDADYFIQNGLKMPPGASRNNAYVAAVKTKAAELMKERGITPQDAMRGGQDFKAAQVMISGMAQTKPGTPGGIVRSINVSIDHLAQLKQALLALKNGDVPMLNRFKLWWEKNTGSALPNNAEAIRTVVAGELNKAIIGGPGAVSDRMELAGQIPTAGSVEQIIGIADSYAKLMAAQGQGLRRQYEVTTKRDDFGRYLSPRTARLLGMDGPQGGAAPVKVRSIQQANALKPGTRYVRPDGQVMTR